MPPGARNALGADEIGRDIRAARDALKRQEKQQTLNIDEIKAQLKAQQSAQDHALNEVWRRLGRPGGAGNTNDLITKDAAGLCVLRHNLASPQYNPAMYVPSGSELDEATIARRVWSGYLRHGDTRRMDPSETKSLSLAKPCWRC